MINFLWILVAFALVLLNAFFVAAEFSMVKLRPTRVEELRELHGFNGRTLAHIHRHLDAYLSACQLGITFASLGLGWIGEPAFGELIAPLLACIGITSAKLTSFIAFFVAFSLLSFLHIVVGELMPKSLAIRQTERVTLWTSVPLYCFYWIMYPAIWMLNTCSNYLLKVTKLNEVHHRDDAYSTEEFKLILDASNLHGELTQEEAEMLEHTLDFAELEVTEVMRPIEELTALDKNLPIAELLKIIFTTRYSRYPIYDESLDNIIGIIHVKNLLAILYKQKELTDITSLIRPILKVQQHSPALELLSKFREGMPHFAMVYNETNDPIGFITLDNLLHILIGRIKDEFHKTEDEWIKLSDGSFLMSGKCSIYAVERALDIDIEVPEEVNTIGGLILHQLENVPQVGDQIEFEQFMAIITKMKSFRIIQVRIYPRTDNALENQSPAT